MRTEVRISLHSMLSVGFILFSFSRLYLIEPSNTGSNPTCSENITGSSLSCILFSSASAQVSLNRFFIKSRREGRKSALNLLGVLQLIKSLIQFHRTIRNFHLALKLLQNSIVHLTQINEDAETLQPQPVLTKFMNSPNGTGQNLQCFFMCERPLTLHCSCGGGNFPFHLHNSKPRQFQFNGARRPTHLFIQHLKVSNPFSPQLQESSFFFARPKISLGHRQAFLSKSTPKMTPATPVIAETTSLFQGHMTTRCALSEASKPSSR